MKEKKCSSCGNWSRHSGHMEDVCEHCGEFLFVNERKSHETKVKRLEKQQDRVLKILETDPPYMVVLKRIGQFFHMVFMVIMSIFIWIIANLAG